ncbi:MAG TPA: YCF48-related protein [Pyrinomonadaceae bacterium]|nr:YCF48-related protein [Pyrinomonadaceae bacterium]
MNEVKSEIRAGRTAWNVTAKRIPDESLHSVEFLDGNLGWIAGTNGISRTIDGGKTWKRITVPMPENAEPVKVLFVTPDLGWIVLTRRATNIADFEENHTWVLRTQDGGSTWEQKAEFSSSVISSISFFDAERGWIAGIRYLGISPLRSSFLVLRTSDRGEHWRDVSDNLISIAAKEEGWITSAISDDAVTATLLTFRGQVLRTYDEGQHWEKLAAIPQEPKQTSLCTLGTTANNYFWFAGGATSLEGSWGVLGFETNQAWLKRRLPGAYFSDAAFVSENEILVSGSIARPSAEISAPSEQQAAILQSSDVGRTWLVVYKESNTEKINALAMINRNHVIAVGERGLILDMVRE